MAIVNFFECYLYGIVNGVSRRPVGSVERYQSAATPDRAQQCIADGAKQKNKGVTTRWRYPLKNAIIEVSYDETAELFVTG